MRDKRKRSPFNRPLFLVWLVLIIVGTSCNLPMQSREIRQVDTATPGVVLPSATVSRQPTHTPTPASTPTLVQMPTPTPVPSPTRTATLALTDASTHTPTETPTATITPTYAILRGKVLAQSNCRYGPGAPYLYKYGLYPGSNLEIIGRNELGTWILVQAIGGHNPCWVKASLMEIKGDVMSVAPASLPLPQSPYYGPPAAVSAVRKGNDVIISWIGIALRAGDDSEQFPYLIEAWVCQSGQQIFTPVGSYATIVTIQDEPGCFEQSHGRLYAVEKHGYTEWVAIPWPPP